jgi:hypothetical protein
LKETTLILLYYSATEVVPNQAKTSQRTFASTWIGNAQNADQARQTANDRITQRNSDLPLNRISSTIYKIDDSLITKSANSRNESIYITTATFHDGSARAVAFVSTPEGKAAAEQKVLQGWYKDFDSRGYDGSMGTPWRAYSTMQVGRDTIRQAVQDIERRDRASHRHIPGEYQPHAG